MKKKKLELYLPLRSFRWRGATAAYIYRPQQNNTDANNPAVKEFHGQKEDSKKVDDNSAKPENVRI